VDGEKININECSKDFLLDLLGFIQKVIYIMYKYGDTFGFIQHFVFRMLHSNIMLC